MKPALTDILDLSKKGVISLIGAGGKTSLMFRLAKELAGSGKRVLTTTTTKIFLPEPEASPDTIITDNFDELVNASKSKLNQYYHFSAASFYHHSLGKLIGFHPDFIDQLWETGIFDWIIVEADGAKQRPLKSTDDHEPVIPKSTRHLILVAGLDAAGMVLDDKYIHRAKLFSNNTGLGLGDIINEHAIAASIAIEIKKAEKSSQFLINIIFLNKADTAERVASGKKIAHYLESEKNINKIVIASLKDELSVKKCFNTQTKE